MPVGRVQSGGWPVVRPEPPHSTRSGPSWSVARRAKIGANQPSLARASYVLPPKAALGWPPRSAAWCARNGLTTTGVNRSAIIRTTRLIAPPPPSSAPRPCRHAAGELCRQDHHGQHQERRADRVGEQDRRIAA